MSKNERFSAQVDSLGQHYVDGPTQGGTYYGGTLWPWTRFQSKDQAERAAQVANSAFEHGFKYAQQEMRRALGLDK